MGLIDPSSISNFKKTAAYSATDIPLLINIARLARRMVVTPHILAEVCNHIDMAKPPLRENLYNVFKVLIDNSGERRIEAVKLAQYSSFSRIGITDVSLVDASLRSHLVVTDDTGCRSAIDEVKGLVININHLRSADWL